MRQHYGGIWGRGWGCYPHGGGTGGLFSKTGGTVARENFSRIFSTFLGSPFPTAHFSQKSYGFPQNDFPKNFSPKIFQNFQDPLLVFIVLELLVFIAKPVGITLSKPIFLRPEKTFPVGTTFRKNFLRKFWAFFVAIC